MHYMKRFNFFLTSIFLSIVTSGCVNQNPAPVEYSSPNSQSSIPNYYGIPQSTKTEEEKITTQDLIVNEPVEQNYKNRDYEGFSYEEKIKKLDDDAEKKNYKKTIVDDEIDKELSEIKKEEKKPKENSVTKGKKKDENKIISEIESQEEEKILESKNKHQIEDENNSKAISDNTFSKPVNGKVINKHEDVVSGKKIKGIYVSSNDGVVKSSSSGEVLFSGYDNDFGNLVIVKSDVGGDEIMVAYANLSSLNVKKGDVVKKEGLIGNVEIGKKVHIAFRKNKKVVDPLEYLKY